MSDGICRYDKHTVNTRDELSGVDVMTLPEAQEASEQWQSVSNDSTDLYFIHKEKNTIITDLYLSGGYFMTLPEAQEASK